MDRRSALAAIGTVAIAGCLSDGSDSGVDERNEPDESDDDEQNNDTVNIDGETLGFDEELVIDDVVYKTVGFHLYDEFDYFDPDAQSIDQYHLENDVVGKAFVRAENYGDESVDRPDYDAFAAVTPSGDEIDPVLELPGGVELEHVRDAGVSANPGAYEELWPVDSSRNSGIWEMLYVVPRGLEQVGVTWTDPDEPVSWVGSPTQI